MKKNEPYHSELPRSTHLILSQPFLGAAFDLLKDFIGLQDVLMQARRCCKRFCESPVMYGRFMLGSVRVLLQTPEKKRDQDERVTTADKSIELRCLRGAVAETFARARIPAPESPQRIQVPNM